MNADEAVLMDLWGFARSVGGFMNIVWKLDFVFSLEKKVSGNVTWEHFAHFENLWGLYDLWAFAHFARLTIKNLLKNAVILFSFMSPGAE